MLATPRRVVTFAKSSAHSVSLFGRGSRYGLGNILAAELILDKSV